MQTRSDGCRLLGSALGKDEFVLNFVRRKVESFVCLTQVLSDVAKSQPHAAFAALTHDPEQLRELEIDCNHWKE